MYLAFKKRIFLNLIQILNVKDNYSLMLMSIATSASRHAELCQLYWFFQQCPYFQPFLVRKEILIFLIRPIFNNLLLKDIRMSGKLKARNVCHSIIPSRFSFQIYPQFSASNTSVVVMPTNTQLLENVNNVNVINVKNH